MKLTNLLPPIYIVAGLLLISSCNSGSDKTTDSTTDSAAVNTEVVTPAPAGPVQLMSVMHKVANFSKWKPSYEAHDSFRTAHGLHSYVVGRGVEDSNMVLVVLRMEDVDKAKAVSSSQELKDRMKEAGVTGAPTIHYGETVMNDTTAIQETIRLMVTHKAKDWDAWKKSFDSHKQTRVDAGLTDRVIAREIGDNNIILVFAVADMEKAKSFINSKDLKDKMAEAGVEGPPAFFFFRIAAKY